MIRILIVDDEKIVRDSLSWIILQEFADECDVRCARNGLEGIDLACEISPDIVLMDVRMPGLSGIDAAQEIKSILPDSSVLFVSAHEDFNYARKALQIGAVDYVNKPVNRREFVAVLKKAIGNYRIKRDEKFKNLKMRNEYFLSRPVIEQNVMYGIILSRGRPGPELMEFERLRCDLSAGGRVFTVQYISGINETIEDNSGNSLFPFEDFEILKKSFKEFFPCLIGPVILDSFSGLILNVPEEDGDAEKWLLRRMDTMWEGLPSDIRNKLKCGVGGLTEIDCFHDSYEQSLSALVRGRVSFIRYFNEKAVQPENKVREYPEIIGDDAETSEILINRLFKNGVDIKDLKLLIAEESAGMVHGLRRNSSLSDPWLSSGDYMDYLMSQNDLNGLMEWLNRFMPAYQAISRNRTEASEFLEKAVGIIDNSFTDSNLSLESVAESCSVSPTYLSARFREVYRINFMQYLTDRRLNLACQMLLDKSLSVKEICYNVGYRDPNYFSRLFRSRYMMTPSEFRKREKKER